MSRPDTAIAYAKLLMPALFLAVIVSNATALAVLLVLFSMFALYIQSIDVSWRSYGRRDEAAMLARRFPEPHFKTPTEQRSFSFIVPAVHEVDVLESTLLRMCEQVYDNFEILVSLRSDCHETIEIARKVERLHPQTVRVFINDIPIDWRSKATQMNLVLPEVKGDYVCIIDAEGKVAHDLLRYADAAIDDSGADIVQGGVTLTNLDFSQPGDSWFAQMRSFIFGGGWVCVHLVLEYYQWFSSRMFYQVDRGFVPLGGNTVFTRTELIRSKGGWHAKRLAEDCHIGVLLSVEKGVKFAAYYTPELATQEHTPPRIFGKGGMFLQRVRWSQGFWQVLADRDWMKVPGVRRKLAALLILSTPIIQAWNGVMLAVSIYAAFKISLPVGLVIFLFMPFIPLLVSLNMQIFALHDFGYDYGREVKPRHYLSLIIMYYGFQVILAAAGVYALVRHVFNVTHWHNTARSVAHQHHVNVPLQQRGTKGVVA